MNQILRMIMNQLIRKGVNYGVNRGIKMASKRGRNAGDDTPMTPEERERQKKLQKMAGGAKKLSRMTKMGRRL
ncbi:hypothetical protein [Thioclava sp. GXIMD2076]|uniref:hypothetical protein n=1 Tax=unclassified Thioclava TaxID=2621713 RepID=UPI0030D0A1D4